MVEDLASPWAAALWKRVPTPAAARGMRLSTYGKLLKKHRIRRFDAAAPKGQLARQPLNVDPASARAAETHVRLLAKRLAVVVEQIAETDGRIDAFLAELGGADPALRPMETPSRGRSKNSATRRSCEPFPESEGSSSPGLQPAAVSQRRTTPGVGETTTRCAACAARRRSPNSPAGTGS